MRENNISMTADLVGYHSPDLYEVYQDDVNKLMKDCIDSGFGFEWMICKVFLLGTIAGVRKERARRRREGSENT